MSGDLGLTEGVALALGGMIGGGIYAVLGVVTGIAGAATWLAFVLAGIVAMCAGYSYNALNELSDGQGGSVTFVQCFTGNSTVAGMVGWTLLFGYIGSMAMYAFAFAEFSLGFAVVPETIGTFPARPVVSVLAVAAFVGLNLLGARSSGAAENVLVAVKVGILVAFGVAGVAYAAGLRAPLQFGFSALHSFGPIVAAAISFVAFQGWQLLFYDQESIADPIATIRKAVYLSIPVAVVIYVVVAVATYALAPAAIQSHPHTALKEAAAAAAGAVGLAELGAFAIAVSALFSTGSAINATLFSTGHFAKGLVGDGLLPDRIGDADADGLPERTVLVVGGVTAVLTAWGSLSAITSFASLAFIVVFGGVSYLAFGQRDQESVTATVPALGAVGSAVFLPLMLHRLYSAEYRTFLAVLALAAAVLVAEFLYFERQTLEEEVVPFEDGLDGLADEVGGGTRTGQDD